MQGLRLSKFGHMAEARVIELLKKHGYTVLKKEGPEGIREDDNGIDFWAQLANSHWVRVQISFNRQEMLGEKGKACLRKGIVPVLIDDDEYDAAQDSIASEKKLLKSFWDQIERAVALLPEVTCQRPVLETMANHTVKGRGS